MKFQVPCECGRRLAVSGARAGATLVCKCGLLVQVPGLRELRDAAPAAALERDADRKRPRPYPAELRPAGIILVGLAFVGTCLASHITRAVAETPENLAVGQVLISLAFYTLYIIGMMLWALGKGYSVWYGFLLMLLCPLGLIVLIFFPAREY
ncbi:hypothetical protein [Fimbriiglobus ruber]|uniref:Uncharacterized protein n=1 Tax=Fimbriiglobus ruber TaxID=1908690 RepID=A0A225D8Z3_9BACT|nr:hypothetical protein [Fimbriiglobus ruber]OWK38031.1 hypothetical protein FRUB_07151 [Fimbriiglobus ruber]